MTTFGWKKKASEKVSKSISTAFEKDTKEENDDLEKEGVDWLTLVPNKKVIGLEDATAKSSRLKQEGTVLAEQERYWEAIKKWDEAIQLMPTDETLYEMKAQALLILCEVYPAVQMARKAVEMKPTWWVAHQTLGRVHLGLGEVVLALKSFSRAIHLNPNDEELWQEDFKWAYNLWCESKSKHTEKETLSQPGVQITELDSDEDLTEQKDNSVNNDFDEHSRKRTTKENSVFKTKRLKTLPKDYVQMRDVS